MVDGPLLNSYRSRDAAAILHPNTDAVANETDGSLVLSRGDGVYVYDEEGNRYLESTAGVCCVSLGFSNDRLADAAARQMRRLGFAHSFFQRSNEPQVELAEKLLALAPAPMSKVFFTSSGSEANDTAIKLIWYRNAAVGRPEKRKIIGRKHAYHGTTIATTSLSGIDHNYAKFGLPLDGFLHAGCPHHYRFAAPGESEAEFATRLAEEIDAMIVAEGPETVAAFFAEPVMGAGGVLLPPETYFDKVQAVLAHHDVMFVADEVICGFGRTGCMWGSETFGIRPDIITCGKALSSGVPADLSANGDRGGVPPNRRTVPPRWHLAPWLHIRWPSGDGSSCTGDSAHLRRGRHRETGPENRAGAQRGH